MASDEPSIAEILGTVCEFLDELSKRVDSGDRYQLLCSQYLLQLARRELSAGDEFDAGEARRLAAYFPGSETARGAQLQLVYGQLAEAIRDGRLDERLDDVLDLLVAHVENKVRVSDPEFLDNSDPA